jgi:DNA-binding HxlR family transcriptional regulator
MKRQTFLIASILPAFELHLLGGPSGAGKTRWIFQSLIDWRTTRLVMGMECEPFPSIAYLAYDRSEASIGQTLSYFPELQVPCYSLRGRRTPISKLPTEYPDIKVFIIDGIATLLPGGRINDYQVVADFLCAAGEVCAKCCITIIGILHASKTKEGEEYRNPRQRIAGSVAWAAFSETVFVVEPVHPDEPEDQKRRLFICPRNAKEMSFDMCMNDNGRLLIESAPDDLANSDETIILTVLRAKGTLSRKELINSIENLGISRATLDRRLDSLDRKGLIDKPKYGHYAALS